MSSAAKQLEQIRLQAAAEVQARKRAGTWAGAVRAHEDYQTRPLDWIVEVLGVPRETLQWSLNEVYAGHQWDGDKDPLVSILEGIANHEDVGVESATGTGKTFLTACIVLWFLACFEDSLVITAAPKKDQLLDQVWKEIGGLWYRFERHFPHAELLTGRIRMRPAEADKEKWAAVAFVAGVGADEEAATKAQGFHAAHMLIITEETPGMDPAIMAAFENTRTDDHNLHLALGNPDHRQDPLHLFCMQEHVRHVRISAFDHPNIVSGRSMIPGAIGAKRLAQRITKYGEGTRLYQSRIRGICPAQASDSLIRWEWCEAAAAKHADPTYREGALALGGDVANNEGGDNASIARWQGACLTEVDSFPVGETSTRARDATEVGDLIYKEATNPDAPVDPRYIGIDSVGVGAATVNELRRQGMKVRHLSGGRRSVPGLDEDLLWSEMEPDLEGNLKAAGPTVIEAERFKNLRSQVWWRLREDLRLGRIALPNDPELFLDLTTPTYTTANGKIVVESKEDIKKRLKRSPDKGDAAAYGNFVRRRRPLKTRLEGPKPNQNREMGLEKLLTRMDKHRQERNKQVERSLRAMARANGRRVG